MVRRRWSPVALAAAGAAVVLLGACGGLGGGGGEVGPRGSASVQGSVGGRDFTFEAARVAARLNAREPDADLTVQICDLECPESVIGPGTSRSVTLTVFGTTADLRSGFVYDVGFGAGAIAQIVGSGQSHADEAVFGQVVIESSDLREGGRTVGTFQLQLVSGSEIQGFFEAPIVEVSGAVVVLD